MKFHVHIYFSEKTSDAANQVYATIKEQFSVEMGKIHNKSLGPHMQPQFGCYINQDEFGILIPWLMLNRKNLSILVHPITGNEYDDHTENCFWLGERLELDLTKLYYE